MTLRFVNSALLILMVVLTITGVYGLMWTLAGWMFEVHRAAGWALIALIPWKAIISLRSLRRGLGPGFDRSLGIVVSVVLSAVTLVVLGLAVLWVWRLGPTELWLRQTAISWHWLLALGLLLPFGLHAWRRWPHPKESDFASRRGFLKLLALGVAGVTGWGAAEAIARWRATVEAPRRFTGSREQGSFSGNQFPITNSAGEGEGRIDTSSWKLILHGTVGSPLQLSYENLLALFSAEITATIDCTLGWYSTQVWRGVLLSDLFTSANLNPQARAVRLKAATGYAHVFTLDEAHEILLATHVDGEPLDHWHGFPVRVVVPSRRGWFWVKWLTEIQVMADAVGSVPDPARTLGHHTM